MRKGRSVSIYLDELTEDTLRLLSEQFGCKDNVSQTIRELCARVRASWEKAVK